MTCLDDAVNYLLGVEDLLAAFASVARLLAPDGIYVFDTNTLATYRAGFAVDAIFERPLAAAIWRGETTGPIEPGALCAAAIAFDDDGDGVSRHVQRHHPEPTIRHALTSAGLACRTVLGQSTGGVLHEDADEEPTRSSSTSRDEPPDAPARDAEGGESSHGHHQADHQAVAPPPVAGRRRPPAVPATPARDVGASDSCGTGTWDDSVSVNEHNRPTEQFVYVLDHDAGLAQRPA